MAVKLLNWNVEWATKSGSKGVAILRRIDELNPDIICLTEAHLGFLPETGPGQLIYSSSDYGYGTQQTKRKVILWSRSPWHDCVVQESAEMPPGRFVCGTTRTSAGDFTVVGVCIPWPDSRVKGVPVKRARWEDHGMYLSALDTVLAQMDSKRLIVVGDYNQRVPKGQGTPAKLYDDLQRVVGSRLTIATAGLGFKGIRTIDHVAIGSAIVAESIGTVSNLDGKRKLSDHFGVVVDLSGKTTRTT